MDYQDKSSGYFANIRADLIGLLEPDVKNLKVLEIGAGFGETLYRLKESGIADVAVGVDIFEDKNNPQHYKSIDRFIFGDIQQLDFPEYENFFDVILLPDVLEHLVEPVPMLHKIKAYLKPHGRVIVSMPNIRHYSALNKIFFKGDFRYEESGIFDYTHMRFYCRINIKELLETSGYTVLRQQSSISSFQGRSVAKLVNKITFGLFEEFLSYQYFFVIRK